MRKRYTRRGAEAWRSAQASARWTGAGGVGVALRTAPSVTPPQLLSQVTFRGLTWFPSGSLGLRLPRRPVGTLLMGTRVERLPCHAVGGPPCRLTP